MATEKGFQSSQCRKLCQKDGRASLASGAERPGKEAPGPTCHADLWGKQVLLPLLQKQGEQRERAEDPSSLSHGEGESEQEVS